MITDSEQISVRIPWRCGSVCVADGAGIEASASQESATTEAQAECLNASLEPERAALRSARTALDDAVTHLTAFRLELIQSAEGNLLELALEIARKVLIQEIQAHRYEIDPIVQDALQHIPTYQDVVVRLHPDDYDRCEDVQGCHEQAGSAGVRFLSDSSVLLAQCIVETPRGSVESSPETRLQDISAALSASQEQGQ